jgi:hypothetical protein
MREMVYDFSSCSGLYHSEHQHTRGSCHGGFSLVSQLSTFGPQPYQYQETIPQFSGVVKGYGRTALFPKLLTLGQKQTRSR